MKIAIFHYWWITNRGGELVVKNIIDLYPNADLYLHVADETLIRSTLPSHYKGNIKTTFIAKLPFANKYYQLYLPLMPFASEQLDLSTYDLVISTESGPGKFLITGPNTLHICYCFSPMRYIWDMHSLYAEKIRFLPKKLLFKFISHYIRVLDQLSAQRVDYFIADSNFVARRIKKYYRRYAATIYPPTETKRFIYTKKREDYYLYLGQLTPYKGIELAVNAFNENRRKLIVIGDGELLKYLKSIANSNIKFMGRQSNDVVTQYLETCKGLIFPGIEDYGIVPIEAMAAGAPVIAYGKGGALETVLHMKTGVIFKENTIKSLNDAISKFESENFDASFLRKHAEHFNDTNFKNFFSIFVEEKLKAFNYSDWHK
ncbi:MAG: glycosyltransferase family 4 protein [Thiothrix sp.]|nr:MAG: glycosyltransferase family 4 protein [Thiothrix sp.]